MSTEDDIRRAERAKLILEDDLVKEAFADIEAEWLQSWRTSPMRDSEGREQLWHMLRALDAFKRYFAAAMDGGKLAIQRLERLKAEEARNGRRSDDQ